MGLTISLIVEKKEIQNVNPLKEAIPEKKVLVRSFSKGNLIVPPQEPKNPLEINKFDKNPSKKILFLLGKVK